MVYRVLFTWYLLVFKAYFPAEEKDAYICKYGISAIRYLVNDPLLSAAWVSVKMIHVLLLFTVENQQRYANKTFIWTRSVLTFQIWNLGFRITFCSLLLNIHRSDRISEFTKSCLLRSKALFPITWSIMNTVSPLGKKSMSRIYILGKIMCNY